MNITQQTLLTQADQCVKCGMCLPHCPTYRKTRLEGHSPRGRISLMQALSTGDIKADALSLAFLDSCLGCRYCETVCPSKVHYGAMLEHSRALFSSAPSHAPNKASKYLQWVAQVAVTQPTALFYGLWLAQRLGMLRLLKKISAKKSWRPLRRLLHTLPKLSRPKHWPEVYPASSEKHAQTQAQTHRGKVALFIGCTGKTLGQATLHASIDCLTQLGYDVALNKNQGCCGFLDRHQGHVEEANALANNNVAAFQSNEKVLTFASGCQTALQEYPQHLGEKAQNFGASVENIAHFLMTHHQSELLTRAQHRNAPPCHVFIHTPCTQHYLKDTGLNPLFAALPNVQVTHASSGQCCGAAGRYFLTQPMMAATLAADITETFNHSGATVFLSSNIGCELHLRAQLATESPNHNSHVMHPLQFLMTRL